MYRKIIKRYIDILISGLGILILFPVMLFLSIVLFISSSENPFFFQSRVGLGSKLFKVMKFRTMRSQYLNTGDPLPDSMRLTFLGRYVRYFSLDEIPQLFNVFLGDMSLVGPRPLLEEYLSLYTSVQNRRHEVRPGITGWAQVNGRNSISWEEKFKLDVWYVDNLTFLLDIKIILLTILKVIKREGITGFGQATTEKFNGQN